MEAYLINAYNLKQLGYIHDNVEDSLLSGVIRRVQDTMIKPIIGTTLFKRLLAGIDADDLNANEILLLQDYITPVLIAGCEYRSVNVITFQIRNKSVGTTRDENLTPVTASEKGDFKDDLRKDYEFYRQTLIGYLCDKYLLYPEYEFYSTDKEDIAPDKGKTHTNIRFI
jgi:hypothetical protein